MLKKTITFKNFNDEEESEEFFFHLSTSELIELELSQDGGLKESLEKIIAAQDGEKIMEIFKKIILGSYGERSPDGKRFIKNQQIREEFLSSQAYDALFVELVTKPDSAVEFINGIIPQDLAEQAMAIGAVGLTVVETEPLEVRTVSRKELNEMPREDLVDLWEKIREGTVRLEDEPSQA